MSFRKMTETLTEPEADETEVKLEDIPLDEDEPQATVLQISMHFPNKKKLLQRQILKYFPSSWKDQARQIQDVTHDVTANAIQSIPDWLVVTFVEEVMTNQQPIG